VPFAVRDRLGCALRAARFGLSRRPSSSPQLVAEPPYVLFVDGLRNFQCVEDSAGVGGVVAAPMLVCNQRLLAGNETFTFSDVPFGLG